MHKILISACLLGQKVRFDGGHHLLDNPIIQAWHNQGRLVPICPEVEGGLPTPRTPAETITQHPIFITTRNGEDVTPEFLEGAEKTLALAKRERVCCALMKSKSPSCGNKQIYDGSFTKTLANGSGVAASELIRHGIPVFNEDELDALFAFVESESKLAI